MSVEDTVWFVPFDSADRTLQTPYAVEAADPGAPGVISPGRQFTVALQAVQVEHDRPLKERLLHPELDVLVLSSSALGSKPLVQRLHYYKRDFKSPLLAHDLLSDVVWVCDDYQDPDPFYVEVKVAAVNPTQERDTAIAGFETFLGTAGSVFPVAMPYIALGEGIVNALGALWKAVEKTESYYISEPLKLFPPGTPHSKSIRSGHFILTSGPIDGAQYQLGDRGILERGDGGDTEGATGQQLSYAVLRVDPVKGVPVDFVVSQRVATLLTQLKNDEEGKPAGTLSTSFGFLTDTLKAYTNFGDLERYNELCRKGIARLPGENEQMKRLAQRDDLKSYIQPCNVDEKPLPA